MAFRLRSRSRPGDRESCWQPMVGCNICGRWSNPIPRFCSRKGDRGCFVSFTQGLGQARLIRGVRRCQPHQRQCAVSCRCDKPDVRRPATLSRLRQRRDGRRRALIFSARNSPPPAGRRYLLRISQHIGRMPKPPRKSRTACAPIMAKINPDGGAPQPPIMLSLQRGGDGKTDRRNQGCAVRVAAESRGHQGDGRPARTETSPKLRKYR